MRAVVTRVSKANLTIDGTPASSIGTGLLVLLGIKEGDTQNEATYLVEKCARLRIFEDENGKMNLSLKDINGEILLVSQFTLAGDVSRGNRPGFETAAKPDDANRLYLYFSEQLRVQGIETQTGIFQADMQVELLNDGPVTFMLEK